MPFDDRAFPGLSTDPVSTANNRRLVANWLFGVCFMIFGMIVLGGATRLTGSGLSIMEWSPFKGVLPPLSEAEWQRLFGLYQQIPQFALVNHTIGLDGFKQIFWLEWVHRLWGRLIGLAFLAPLVVLWASGKIERRLRPRLAILFALGGLQGAVGWFMVASGFFPDSTAVSPYRLVIHLALALFLYSAILWTALTVRRPVPDMEPGPNLARRLTQLACISVAVTILAGGFVAGNHAGLVYNTFPLMDGQLVPAGYSALSPVVRNLTENVAAVQFDHRLLASVSLLIATAATIAGLRGPVPARARPKILALGALVTMQYCLGIATLLWVVPVGLATAHQALAVLVLTATLTALHAQRAGNPARI